MPDAPVPLDRLLAHRPWVRALARSLVATDADADDLEQEAWIAAIEKPPRHEASLRGWFASVVRRRAAMSRRTSYRRDLRERIGARPEATAPAGDVVVEAESHARVVQAVVGLPEPEKTTVLLRFFESLSPREVAARMNVPEDTVRSRLRRALARLRERLDEEHGGDGRAWCAALLPLAGIARRSAAPATVAAAAIGGLVVAKKLALACVLVVLLFGGAWLVLPRDESTAAHPRRDVASAAVARRAAERRADAARDAGAAADDKPATEPAPAPVETGPARIAGRVTDERSGGGVAGAEVFVLGGEGSEKDLAAAKPRTRADADGRFACDGLAVGPHHVVARAPGLLDGHAHGVDAVASGGKDVKLVLLRPRSIAGRVVAPPGVPLDGTVVHASIPNDRTPSLAWWTNIRRDARVAKDGTFLVERLSPHDFDVYAQVKVGGRDYSAALFAVEPDGPPVTLTLDEDLRNTTRRIVLHVLDGAGRPVVAGQARRHCLNFNGSSSCGTQPVNDGLLELELTHAVRCVWYEPFSYRDADGRDVPVAPYFVCLSHGLDLEKTVRLAPAVSIEGRVRDSAGRGIAGARVSARPAESPEDEDLSSCIQPHGGASSAVDGAFRIDGLAPVEYRLAITVPPEFAPAADVRAKPGDTVEIALSPALQPVVAVEDADGKPVVGAELELFEDENARVASATTGADGKARLDRVPPGRRFRLEVDANDDRFATLVVPDWTPTDATFHLPAGYFLRGTVVDGHGAPVPGAWVYLKRRDGGRDQDDDTNDRGVFVFERLPAGEVRLVASVNGDKPDAAAPTVAASAGDRSVVLVVDPGLVLRAKIENWGDRDPTLIWGSPVFIEDGDPPAVTHDGRHRADRMSFSGLPAGRTGTIVFGPMPGGFVVFRPGVRTDAGDVTVTLVRGATLEGRIVFPDGVPPQAVEVKVYAEVVGVQIPGETSGAGRWSVRGVPDGAWTVHATLKFDGHTYEGKASARPGVAADIELR